MKKLIPVVLLVIIGAFVTYKLMTNKARMEETVSLAEAVVQEIPVTTYTVKPVQLEEALTLSGKLAATGDLMLMSTTQGRVEEVFVDKGVWVNKGQVIAKVEDALLREQYDVATSAYEKLKKDEERFKIMAASDAITQQQLEGLELNLKQAEARYLAARKQWEDTRIKSPMAGYINQMFVKSGALIGAGVPVCEIVNDSELKLSIKVSDTEVRNIRQLEDVKITLGAVASDTLPGKVAFTSVKPDYAGLYTVDVTVEGAQDVAGAGMLASAHFPLISRPDALYVPIEGVLGFGEQSQYMYVARDGKAARVKVQAAEQIQGYVAVSGISPGDKVILRGNTIVRDGQNIRSE